MNRWSRRHLKYLLLTDLSANTGRLLAHDQMLRREWGWRHAKGSRSVHTYVRRLRLEMGDDAGNPAYIFTKRRVGYWMARGVGSRMSREPWTESDPCPGTGWKRASVSVTSGQGLLRRQSGRSYGKQTSHGHFADRLASSLPTVPVASPC